MLLIGFTQFTKLICAFQIGFHIMEKKIKPHTTQTFQAVIYECDLLDGGSGCSEKLWQLHRVGQ